MPECQHEVVQQTSELMVRWAWNRQPDGSYEPEETHNKVLWEETIEGEDAWVCADCEARLTPMDGEAGVRFTRV